MANSSSSRPLSPHLSVYKLQETMVMSGLHRITGMAMAAGLLIFTWFFVAAAFGPGYYETHFQPIARSWVGLFCLFGWTFCIFYHLGTGIRHLAFDFGHCLSVQGIVKSGWAVAIFAAGATVLTWVIGLIALGAK